MVLCSRDSVVLGVRWLNRRGGEVGTGSATLICMRGAVLECIYIYKEGVYAFEERQVLHGG